ncbi:MAG TPA: NAD(P)-dependent alcohol dehydrogenase [Candidatus Limnocylindrales bacterium]|nr:NAD(P)-dependent alcohol dehydrogenase [Candidatus Limnocylindrales bacterium]
MADTMRAAVYHKYGRPDVVEIQDVEMPVMGDNQMLVRVRAAGVNPHEWHRLTGRPILYLRRRGGWRRPRNQRLGSDFAGVVEAVGRDVTGFRPGDEVFGTANGSFAEYVIAREGGSVVRKPTGVTFEQAAAVPIAALTALQGLRDRGRLEAGHRVLVNGASGGVGTFAVQIAKAFGANVTGVCSTRNVDLVRSLGADDVIDYTREDFTRTGHRYDLLLDNISNKSWPQYRRVLQPEATLVFTGGLQRPNRLVGAVPHQRRIVRAARRDSRTVAMLFAMITHEDLEVMAGLLESGKVTTVVDRHYRLDETADALRYLGQKHVPGKIVIVP